MMGPIAVLACAAAMAGQSAPGASGDSLPSRHYRETHEEEILEEFTAFLRLPNSAAHAAGLARNAGFLTGMLRARGFTTRLLASAEGASPAVYAELAVPGARRTLLIYTHYDGQPVDPSAWGSDPWTPVMRAGPDPRLPSIEWRGAEEISGEWRLFARSSSDAKAPIQALVSALDSLREANRSPRVNIKLLVEGDEEQGSPHLPGLLQRHRQLLAADLVILADGPVHPSGRTQLYFGARGLMQLELTVFGPLRPLHDGHYGNWAPNPAIMLSHLLASMRDEEGGISIARFNDDVRPIEPAGEAAIADIPASDGALAESLALGRREGRDRLARAVTRPALNVRGIHAGAVGEAAVNAIPSVARASIDLRLVPDQRPERVRAAVESHLRLNGWFIVDEAPAPAVLAAHRKVVRVDWELGYPGHREPIDGPAARALADIVGRALGEPIIRIPNAGGSVDMHSFAQMLAAPVVGLPIVNADNNQHGANENVRLQNLWDGIDIFAALLAELDW